MQKLGQHFLKNDAVMKKIIDALELRAGDVVIEIGPGHGELTVPLSHACAAAGTLLTVIEKDVKLADGLREKFTGTGIESAAKDSAKIWIKIECGDALKILEQTIEKIIGAEPTVPADQSGVRRVPTLKLVGNLPYYITGKLLRIISELKPQQIPERCVFMVQREVAERIIAVPPAMNRLAASVQFWADAKIIAHVPRTDFSPPPKIDSAVIALTTKPAINNSSAAAMAPALYYEAIRAIFAQPRKMLINNLIAADKRNVPKTQLLQMMQEMELTSTARPQDLSIKDIIGLAKVLF
jgi:16S rRNA (adenine1518-N6/adenine1519-N6)-dimethyltransferase